MPVTWLGSTGAPFSVSLLYALPALPPLAPFTGPNTSSVATIGAAATTTVAVALSQLLGFSTSQIVYGYVYVPAGVPADTVIVPSGFITRPACGLVPGVSVTWDGTTGEPFKVSFTSTDVVVPPEPPLIGAPEKSSSTASITGALTVTVMLAVSQ
ncbi:hypothetical protein, partial [Luteimonas sp. e5]